jgi:hypothetical protein
VGVAVRLPLCARLSRQTGHPAALLCALVRSAHYGVTDARGVAVAGYLAADEYGRPMQAGAFFSPPVGAGYGR